MQTPYNSSEIMSENESANVNRHPSYISEDKEGRNSFKRTQSLPRNPPEYNSKQATAKRESNSGRNRAKENENNYTNSSSKKRSNNVFKRIYLWCGQCCRKKKSKLSKVHKSKKNFWKRLREKCKKRKEECKRSKRRKRTSFSKDVLQHEDEVEETSRKSKDLRKRRRRSRRKKRDVPESSVHSFETDEEEESTKGVVSELGIDFTKSCCYLCAKSTMAIAAAMSNKMEKYHISIQASTKELFTADKGCNPSTYVRTVQSSVKVKKRDMSTSYPEKKKRTKTKPKLKLKHILPKLKLPTYPKVRTVACETDKSTRHKNIPQCRGRRENHCVTEADIKQ